MTQTLFGSPCSAGAGSSTGETAPLTGAAAGSRSRHQFCWAARRGQKPFGRLIGRDRAVGLGVFGFVASHLIAR